MTALLRPAVEGDLTQVTLIEKSSFADPWSEESFRRLIGVAPAIFLVALFPPDDAIAGYVVAFSVGEDGELLNVAVDPKFRGRGLAGQMLDAVLIELGARGVRTAFLEVRESNTAARALYESRNFVEIGRRSKYYRRPVEDALVLRRTLEVAEGDSRRAQGSFADR
ncbi:MAG: [ribosomal protein S18]-alanine N-acetyltransferase [Gemmatimonadaceae bacterium]|jgi:ribosomal-protein-alanine N-acetyltransferase|nr:[ribosomal protein S18]-alanine N-acetyltransferase [Gemmatimonadaceae bacterium]